MAYELLEGGGDGFGVFLSQGMLALLFLRTWIIGADSAVSNSPPQRVKPFLAKTLHSWLEI